MTIPAPGGAVSAKTLAVYTLGGSLGIALYANVITQYIPDSWEHWEIGPINGLTTMWALSAMIGAAIAAKLADAIGK